MPTVADELDEAPRKLPFADTQAKLASNDVRELVACTADELPCSALVHSGQASARMQRLLEIIGAGGQQPEAAPTLSGAVVSGWRFEEVIGRGGFATVYAGRHDGLGYPVAIKVLHPQHAQDQELEARFEQEARLMASLRDERLVRILDNGRLPTQQPYLVMERLQGESLRERLRRAGQLEPAEFCVLAEDLLAGLEFLHGAGIIHRDIKPENVFVLSDSKRMKLLDLGLARAPSGLTMTTRMMGTPGYLPPEVLSATPRAWSEQGDVYCAAVVLYEALSGKHPQLDTATSPGSRRTLRSLQAAGVELPGPIDDAIRRGLSAEPDARPRGAAELHRLIVPAARCWAFAAGHPKSRQSLRCTVEREERAREAATDATPSLLSVEPVCTVNGDHVDIELRAAFRRDWLPRSTLVRMNIASVATGAQLVLGSDEPRLSACSATSTERCSVIATLFDPRRAEWSCDASHCDAEGRGFIEGNVVCKVTYQGAVPNVLRVEAKTTERIFIDANRRALGWKASLALRVKLRDRGTELGQGIRRRIAIEEMDDQSGSGSTDELDQSDGR